MKLSISGMAMAGAIVWGACLLMVGLANLVSPAYGRSFLELCSSVYPGYHATASIGGVVVGTLYAVVDGGIGGAIFAWVYNLCAK